MISKLKIACLLPVFTLALCNCSKTPTDIAEDKCNQGDGKACVEAGTAYNTGVDSKGKKIEVDQEKAKSILLKACSLGQGEICASIADELVKGQNPDFVAATEFYQKACEAGFKSSCSNLGLIFANGNDIRQNYA